MAKRKYTTPSISIPETLRLRAARYAARRRLSFSALVRRALANEMRPDAGPAEVTQRLEQLIAELVVDLGADRAQIAKLLAQALGDLDVAEDSEDPDEPAMSAARASVDLVRTQHRALRAAGAKRRRRTR